MKTINKILTAAAATALSTSCVTYYTVIPEIHPDGSMTRTVYAEADSACLAGNLSSHPFLFEPGEQWQTGRMAEPRTPLRAGRAVADRQDGGTEDMVVPGRLRHHEFLCGSDFPAFRHLIPGYPGIGGIRRSALCQGCRALG